MNHKKRLSFLLIEQMAGQSDALLESLSRQAKNSQIFVSIAHQTLPSLNQFDAILICTGTDMNYAMDILRQCHQAGLVAPLLFSVQPERLNRIEREYTQDIHIELGPPQSYEQLAEYVTEVTSAEMAHRVNFPLLAVPSSPAVIADTPYESTSSNPWADVNDVGHLLLATHDTEQIISSMLQNAVDIIGAAEASVWIWKDEQQEMLVCHATSNPAVEEILKAVQMPRGEGIAGWVVEHQISTIAFDTYKDPRFHSDVDKATGFRTESILGVPLRYGDTVLGVLEVLNKTEGMFTLEDATLVETLARSATIALENARLMERLSEQKAALEAQNRELDKFASTVAHDIQRLISNCSLNFELLVDTLPEQDELQGEFTGGVRHNVSKMEELTQELLFLAKISSDPLDLGMIDISETVDAAVSELSMLTVTRSADIEMVSGCLPNVCGHKTWVERVWVNYISNAIKYGGTPPRIRIGCDDNETFVTFWVQDNGDGLEKEQIDRLFEPFPDFRDKTNGTGLGLSIVRRMVERMGGTVSAESVLGEGSTFKFTLQKFGL